MSRFVDGTRDIGDAENRPGSRYGLVLASAFLLTVAAGVWSIRAQKAALRAERSTHQLALREAREQARSQERRTSQRAVSLLIRTFLAEKQVSYSALASAWATYAGKEMQSTARITRTPTAMAISYVGGDNQGLNSGYNERWLWRRKGSAPLEAYAEMATEAPSVVARRLTLLLNNYSVELARTGKVGDREVEVLEIRPLQLIDGAKGPGKHLSIDKETGLALETETFDHEWRRTMKSSLSQLDLTPTITKTTFASPGAMSEAAKRKTWMARDMGTDREDVARETGWVPPAPKYLPPGFAFDSAGVHHCGDAPSGKAKAGTLAAMARYTDGLNTLSVFAMPEPSASGGAPEQVCDFGPGTLVSKRGEGGFIIAVSDLPAKTLHKVVGSTELKKASR